MHVEVWFICTNYTETMCGHTYYLLNNEILLNIALYATIFILNIET